MALGLEGTWASTGAVVKTLIATQSNWKRAAPSPPDLTSAHLQAGGLQSFPTGRARVLPVVKASPQP